MKLVRLDNYDIKWDEELLLYPAFRKVYKADKTKSKARFIEFLSILYFTYDLRSDYQYVVDENERLKLVCETNGYDIPKFTKDQLDCIVLYKNSTNTTSTMLLQDTKITIDNIRKTLRDTSFEDFEDKDRINAIKTAASIVAIIPKLIKDLSDAERAVTKEIQESGRARGQKEKTLMDDGIMV